MSTPELSQSPKLYQERKEPDQRNTRRTPGPRIDLDANEVHNLAMEPPLPLVETLHLEDHKPPDAGLTQPWPWGGREEIV